MRRYQLYIFNFDNTLFDTSQGLELCYRSALSSIGVEYQQEMLGEFIREPLEETFARYGSDASMFKVFEDAFYKASDDSIRDSAVIFSDTVDVVRLLKDDGRSLSVVTGRSPDAVRDVLQKYRMSDMFDNIIGHGDYSHGPPDPEAIAMCIQRYPSVERGDAVYVGDTRFDMDAARAAGIDGVFIDRPGERTENGTPGGICCARIRSLYGLVAECRICTVAAFSVRYDLLDESIDLNNVVNAVSEKTGIGLRLDAWPNRAKVTYGNTVFNIFPRGIVIMSRVSDNMYPLDTDMVLRERDAMSATSGSGRRPEEIASILDAAIHSLYPRMKKDKISSHFRNDDAYVVTSYHLTCPLTMAFETHFAGEVLHLLTKKKIAPESLYAELDRDGIPYHRINDREMIAATRESRVFIGDDDSMGTFMKYLDYEARAQNAWFLTSLMNDVVDNLASSDMDSDLIAETIDTMYTNATFKYVVSSSNNREDAGIMDTLYAANNLDTISRDFRNKAELLNQKIELGIKSWDAKSTQTMNNVLLALTIVSSASAVFQILGYWYINTFEYNMYSLAGTLVIICAVLAMFFVTNRKGRRPRTKRLERDE